MKTIVIIILLSTLLIGCDTNKKSINSNHDKLKSYINDYAVSKLNNPESYEFVSLNIDSIFNIKYRIKLCNGSIEYYKNTLSLEGIEKRETFIKKRLKWLKGTNREAFIKRNPPTETLKENYVKKKIEADSLRKLINTDLDSIIKYNIRLVYRYKNAFNALVLDTLTKDVTWDLKIIDEI